MAINLLTRYPGKVGLASPDYPTGTPRNVTADGAGDGTPWEELIIRDFIGFRDAALAELGEAANNLPETAQASQVLNGVRKGLVSEAELTANGQTVEQISEVSKETQPYKDKEVDLLIVYGQSNAVGFAANSPGDPTYLTDLARVWDGSAFVALTPYTPLSDGGTSTGSAWAAFGNEYVKQTGRRLVICNCARGSQSIADLQKGGAVYTDLTNFVNGAKAELTSEGSTLGKTIVAFNQGERDSDIDTTPTAYTSALSTLWTDLKTDFSAQMMGLFTVGYYADSRLIHAQAIQQAQRTFARDNDDVIIAYDNLGSFGSHNDLKVDVVHYNQHGYNIMGREGAKRISFAVFPDTSAPASDDLIKRFGSMGMNQSQAWNLHAAVIRKVADGNWSVNHSNIRASSNILACEELADRLQLKLACPATTIMQAQAASNGALERAGGKVSIGTGINWASEIVPVDADGYSFVDLFFRTNLFLKIDLAAQTVTNFNGTVLDEFVSNEITVTFPSTGRCDIAHPSVTGLALGSIIGGTARTIRVNAGTTLTILQLRDATDSLVNDTVSVMLPEVIIPPASVANTTDISFMMIAADYAVW